ncbi:MAG: phytanoyl-CoA dioxygenase family protein [Proteobacteria bacterium]|nr:phytanoyl-CoA dioxygenase family protein [Pseudomonadota bacterium]
MKLSTEQIEKFKSTGYLVVRNLYDADEMKDITAWTEEVTNYPEVPGKYMMYFEESKLEPGKRILSRMEDIEPFHQGLSELFVKGKIQQITSQLFDDEAILFKDKINFKMPGGDGFKAHQDVQAGWDRYGKVHITALVSIDSSTIENGCLEVAGGYHDKGLIGESWKPLEEDALDYIPVPTEPGDAVFFDSYAPHRSKPNMTNEQRRVLYVTYNAAAEGDHRRQYYDDKRLSYPPDIERDPNKEYVFRV